MDAIDEVLTAAADLLEKPGAWTQGAMARTASNVITGARDPDAVCFCVVGVLLRLEHSPSNRSIAKARISGVIGDDDDDDVVIDDWNDAPGRTQAEVVAVLRAARVTT